MVVGNLGKRKRITNLSSRLAIGLQADEVATPPPRDENINCDAVESMGNTNNGGLTLSSINGSGNTNAEGKL